jgi:hypothetical protein
MDINCGTNSDGSPNIISAPDISGGGSDVDITKWQAQRLNLSIQDVMQTIQEGRMSGAVAILNIGGNNSNQS